ncbi:alkaline phosphatase family protein [Membranihabitans marinus]|uniref:alkaline phosphatase family protein n=1 Tax=Membranihabitans marinus TaxID=1227546 RepID=UPI001F3596E7|nr:alkaline phosphatase family protein [Membranihabitans marinus]
MKSNCNLRYIATILCLVLIQACTSKEEVSVEDSIDPKVVLVTLDGLRWQELFSGADPSLINHTEYVSDTAKLKALFWRDNPQSRRQVLMPFMWKTIGLEGQLYGNRVFGNHVNLTNNQWFSYPGYSEILCGFADDNRINSNDKINNENTTVLEYVHNQAGFQGKVAAFASWDVFPYIINEMRSGIPVNAGYEDVVDPYTEEEKLINQLQHQTPKLWESVRLDGFTHQLAMSHLVNHRSKLLYIAYGETDDFAHEGKYDEYLKAARRTDDLLSQLWKTLQSDPFYKDQTTLLITTDHGRGVQPIDQWRHHGKSNIPRSDEVWIAAIGPKIASKGEINTIQQLYSNQIAATIAKILGFDYPEERAGKDLLMFLQP